jgi:O-methyltransferase involved in polyketide biosynthesis
MVLQSELPEQLSGVGATALGVARLRVAENARPDRLVADPYAGHILAAAAAAESPWAGMSPQAGLDFFALMADQVAVRTPAWLTEGILYALPGEAADTLLDRITDLSAPGSALALDHIKDSPSLRAARAAVSPDLLALWQGGPADLTDWLTDHGWQPTIHDLREVAADYHRSVPAELTGAAPDTSHAWLATATPQEVHIP